MRFYSQVNDTSVCVLCVFCMCLTWANCANCDFVDFPFYFTIKSCFLRPTRHQKWKCIPTLSISEYTKSHLAPCQSWECISEWLCIPDRCDCDCATMGRVSDWLHEWMSAWVYEWRHTVLKHRWMANVQHIVRENGTLFKWLNRMDQWVSEWMIVKSWWNTEMLLQGDNT